MRTIRYAHEGSGKYEIIGVRVTTEFKGLRDDEKMDIWYRLENFFKSNGVLGQVVIYWGLGQQWTAYGPLKIERPQLGEFPGDAYFDKFAHGLINCDDKEILSYIW